MFSNWIQVVIGCTSALVISWALIRWVAPLGWVDCPDQARKLHVGPTARTGGMVLWGGLILLQVSGKVPFPLGPTEWVAIHAMALIGLLDDRLNLRARYKALSGLAVALLLAFHVTRSMDQSLGGTLSQVSFLGLPVPTHSFLVFPFLVLWFWAIPQAYNLIDGINGLSLGFAALLLGVLGGAVGQNGILWGGLGGVLAFNFPKARHFLGDCGALMLGTLFAILGVEAFAFSDPNLLFWVFAYPIVDVSLVVGIRWWKDLPLSLADRSHLHHWMMDRLGGRVWLATPVLLVFAALPMLRATPFPGHLPVSAAGLLALVMLALKAFKDRVSENQVAKVQAQVRRDVPFVMPEAMRAHSGPHPKL